MRFRKTAIVFLTALFIIVAGICGVVCARMHPQTTSMLEKIPMEFHLETGGTTQRIVPWYDDQSNCYIFLPSCADLQYTKIQLEGNGTLLLGARQMGSGMDCGWLRLEEAYPAIYTGRQGAVETVITFLRSENLPAVYVDTRSGDISYIHALKGNEEPGEMRIFLPDGSLRFSGTLRGFGGRGNATWERPKKPYKLELQQEADLLGMGAAKNWVLLSNALDPSHIRNKTVYDAAQQVGLAYSPESVWVDLYLNGEYAGLYLLCEKNEVHPNRVDIDEAQGVLISIEKADRLWEYGGNQFVTEHGIPIRVRHSNAEIAHIQEKLGTLENALLASDGVDAVTGKHWSELIDVESWAKKYLIEEVFGNLDAGSISQFFYWEGDGKIFAGPVWDYDITMGNYNWQMDVPQMLYSGRPHLWDPEDTPWFYALYQKPEFRERVTALYAEQFRPLLQALLSDGMNASHAQISSAASLDRTKWPAAECRTVIEQIRQYMIQRMEFLDSLWITGEEYHLVSVFIKEHVMACYAVRNGECIAERPVPDGTDTIIYEAWYDDDTDRPFDFSMPITGDKLIYLKETNLLTGGDGENGFSLRKAITYVPTTVFLVIMLGMLTVDWKARNREDRRRT